MRALCLCATVVGVSVTGQGATVSGLEFLCRRTLKVLKIEYRALKKCGKRSAFCGAIAVAVGESRHGFLQDGGQLVVGDVSVVPIEPVLDGAVRRHVIGGSKKNESLSPSLATDTSFTTISF